MSNILFLVRDCEYFICPITTIISITVLIFTIILLIYIKRKKIENTESVFNSYFLIVGLCVIALMIFLFGVIEIDCTGVYCDIFGCFNSTDDNIIIDEISFNELIIPVIIILFIISLFSIFIYKKISNDKTSKYINET